MTSDLNIPEEQKSRKIALIVGPSGLGKTKLLKKLREQGPFTGLQSNIEYTGPTIRHTVDPEGVESWEVEGRMPRRKNKDVSIWPDGIIDIHDFILTDPRQREEAQTNIDSGVYSLADADFAKVSDTDNEMYRFLNKVDYAKALKEASAAGLHASNEKAFGTWRSYIFPDEGGFVVECAPEAVCALYRLAKEAGYSTTVFFIQAPKDLLLGQMTIFREEPAGVVKDRMLATEQMNSDSSNPETVFGQAIDEIEKAGDYRPLFINRNIFQVEGDHTDNGRPYNFKRTPEDELELQFLDKPEDCRFGDPGQLQIDYILGEIAGQRPPRDQGELEERIFNIIIEAAKILLIHLEGASFKSQEKNNDEIYPQEKQNQVAWLTMLCSLQLRELKEARERDSTTETKMKMKIR